MKKTVLITGGLGFIGTNFIKCFQDKFDFKILDNLSNLHDLTKQDFENKKSIIIGDLRDYDTCVSATEDVDMVIHLGAKGSVVDSVIDPLDNYENNVTGTFNILKAATQNGVKKIVFASTGGALMGDCKLPVSEESLPRPIAPYGASKLAGEGYCHAFANVSDTSITILRFANIYGINSGHKKGLVNAVMRRIDIDEDIEIYGDGSATRDFLYVDDLCDGIYKALLYNHKGSEIFHLASAKEVSILEVVQTLLKISGKNNKIVFKEKREGEVEHNVASYEKAKKTLYFTPSTSLEEGLQKCWDWFIKTKVVK